MYVTSFRVARRVCHNARTPISQYSCHATLSSPLQWFFFRAGWNVTIKPPGLPKSSHIPFVVQGVQCDDVLLDCVGQIFEYDAKVPTESPVGLAAATDGTSSAGVPWLFNIHYNCQEQIGVTLVSLALLVGEEQAPVTLTWYKDCGRLGWTFAQGLALFFFSCLIVATCFMIMLYWANRSSSATGVRIADYCSNTCKRLTRLVRRRGDTPFIVDDDGGGNGGGDAPVRTPVSEDPEDQGIELADHKGSSYGSMQ
jgi:hypothetical protein